MNSPPAGRAEQVQSADPRLVLRDAPFVGGVGKVDRAAEVDEGDARLEIGHQDATGGELHVGDEFQQAADQILQNSNNNL